MLAPRSAFFLHGSKFTLRSVLGPSASRRFCSNCSVFCFTFACFFASQGSASFAAAPAEPCPGQSIGSAAATKAASQSEDMKLFPLMIAS